MPIQGLDVLLSLPQLPALTLVESAIGKAWLRAHANEYDSVTFNMRLGAGVTLPPGTPAWVYESARAGTTKRTDIVAHRGSDATIVEVKKRISLGSLGQLLGYQALYLQDNPQTGVVRLVAAGLSIQDDITGILNNHGITVELFPDASI